MNKSDLTCAVAVTAGADRLSSIPGRQSARPFEGLSGHRLIETLAVQVGAGRCAVVSSFGADSVVLLHLVSEVDRHIPVLFIDTGMHFPETLRYRDQIVERLGLADLRVVRPSGSVSTLDPDDTLHRTDPDRCCDMRKTRPLEQALAPFDCWFNGRKRFQGGLRQRLENVEMESSGRLRANPLFNWTDDALRMYKVINKLPRHPLEIHGYESIGCRTCTIPGCNDSRSGRWAGTDKTECGIFFDSTGAVIRANQNSES